MKKSNNFYICVWLAIIALILLLAVVILASYIYKSDILFSFSNFNWNEIEAIGTILIGVVSILITIRINKLQSLCNRLYIEPHVMVDSFEVIENFNYELSLDKNEYKTIKNYNYPFFVQSKSEGHKSSFILSVTLINTSEAFARLRFKEAQFINSNNIIAEIYAATVGTHNNHFMLHKNDEAKIGLVLNKKLLSEISDCKIKLSFYLDNNYNATYLDTQSYALLNKCDDVISFMPADLPANNYKEIRESSRHWLHMNEALKILKDWLKRNI